MTILEKIRIVAGILKKRFSNLSTDETIKLATDILEALENKK